MQDSWEALARECAGCRECALHQTRKNVVFGVGNPQAEIMLEPPLETKGKVTPVRGSRSTVPSTLRMVWTMRMLMAAQAPMV